MKRIFFQWRQGRGGEAGHPLDPVLHRSLTAEAKRALRSLNSEMLWRLRSSFGDDGWRDWPASNERAS
jgi:hypothetical protein